MFYKTRLSTFWKTNKKTIQNCLLDVEAIYKPSCFALYLLSPYGYFNQS